MGYIRTNWKHMSTKKMVSMMRLKTKRRSTSWAGARKDTSHGVTRIVKISATATTISDELAALEERGSMTHQFLFLY